MNNKTFKAQITVMAALSMTIIFSLICTCVRSASDCFYNTQIKEACMLSVENEDSIICMDKYPYVIGSFEKMSDVVIKALVVSRMHCCIYHEVFKDDEFEKRKNMAKIKGEEATTKLLMPMMMMLMIVMAIIMIPAVWSFQI